MLINPASLNLKQRMKNGAPLQSRQDDFSYYEIAPGVRNFFQNYWRCKLLWRYSGISSYSSAVQVSTWRSWERHQCQLTYLYRAMSFSGNKAIRRMAIILLGSKNVQSLTALFTFSPISQGRIPSTEINWINLTENYWISKFHSRNFPIWGLSSRNNEEKSEKFHKTTHKCRASIFHPVRIPCDFLLIDSLLSSNDIALQ